MQAIVLDGFGGTEVMRLADVPTPRPAAGEVLIKAAGTAVNRADLHQREAAQVVRTLSRLSDID